MPEHPAGSRTVSVSTRSRNYFFYRRQGIRIEISPERNWWCLWLCSSTTEIDRITSSIVLTGPAQTAEVAGQCSDCGDLNVMGPSFWGFNVPRAYDRVNYRGIAVVDGQGHEFAGEILYT